MKLNGRFRYAMLPKKWMPAAINGDGKTCKGANFIDAGKGAPR
jgi:hypothetical protein